MYSALDNELASYPLDVLSEAKRQAGLSDGDPQSLTTEEKQYIHLYAARLRQNPPNGGGAGPSGVNTHGQLSNWGPMAQPIQAQLSMPQREKRNSTSPGEQSHLRGPKPRQVPNRLSGPLVPIQSGKGMPVGGPMQPPGQPGMSRIKPGGKEPEGEGVLNAPLNPAASAPTFGPFHNSALPTNPQRPPSTTANAPMPTAAPPPPPPPGPGPMGDLSFDMSDMFGSNGGDFDFGPSSLDKMDLWFESTAVHDDSTPAPPPPPPPGMADLSFDTTDTFGSNGGDFDFGPNSLDNLDLWFESTPAVHDGSTPAPPPAPAPVPGRMGDPSSDMTDMFGRWRL